MELQNIYSKGDQVICVYKYSARQYITEQKPDAFMSFIAQGSPFDSPLNLFMAEILGDDFINNLLEEVKSAKSGDVIFQKTLSPDLPDFIFSILPIWDTALSNEEKFLSRCYRKTLSLAKNQGYKTLAFPALGRGRKGFPHQRVVRLSLAAIFDEFDLPLESLTVLCSENIMYDAYSDRLDLLLNRSKG